MHSWQQHYHYQASLSQTGLLAISQSTLQPLSFQLAPSFLPALLLGPSLVALTPTAAMFGGDDDDLPVKGSAKGGASKLSSLFAAEENLTSASTQSLGYTAKKPKSSQPPPAAAQPQQASVATAGQSSAAAAVAASPAAPVVLFASLVNLLRYDASNTAVPVGQRAVAILKTASANPAVSVHVLVAYEPSSQKQDFIVALSESFHLTAAPPAYVMLYDDNRQYWCMQLAADQLDSLLKHVAMAKHAQAAQTNPAHAPLIAQDLTAATTDRPAASGDTLKLKYSMWLTAPTHPKGLGGLVGSVGSDEKPKQVKLGAKKELAGIEQGVVGMRKGGKRFLVIPSHLAYGGQQAGSIPPHSTLLVEVTCIKVKYAEANAPAPSPPATPALPAAVAPAVSPSAEGAGLAGSVPGGVTVPSMVIVDDEEDGQRNRLAHKMAGMGFKMPGLPGAVDPDHLAARQAEERRRNSVDSREGSSQPPSPALSSVSVATSAPSLSLLSPVAQPGHVPSLPSLSVPHPNSQQPTQPPQSMQPSQYYQQPPSTPYYQQSQQPPQQQPQHSSMQQQQQPSQPYSSFSSPSHQYNSGYGYEGGPHYSSAGTPSHLSPAHTPHPSYPYTGHPGHHHTNSLPHSANFQQQPPQSQQVSSLSSPLLAAIDSKLDALQVSIAQSNRILGTSNSSLLYESPLSGAQLIRALNSLLQERDDARSKAEASERRTTELTAKLSAMQERYEKNSEDNSRMMERRYEQYADELKSKNAHIVELQAGVRRAEHEAQQAALVRVEAESEVARLREALAKEKEESRGRAEAERQVIMLQLQLKQTAEAVEGKEQESKLVMQQKITEKESEIAGLRHEAERRQAEDEREKTVLQQTIDTLKQQMAHSQQRADNTIAELHTAVARQEEEHTRLQGEIDRLHSQVDHMQQNTVSVAEHQALQAQLTAAQEQLRQAQRETEEAREETASVIVEVRSRREQDKQAMLAAIEQARADEYERGQQETMEEVRQTMQAIKDKARATIEQLAADKEQLEENLKAAEEEKQTVIDSSRAYIDRMKAQMAARLAEVEGNEGVSEEREEEEKAAAMKSVYSGVSRVLQQYAEKRWRAAEVAMVLRAEVQFVLSGERPEVSIAQEEEEAREEVKEVEKVAVVQERLSELKNDREEEGDHDTSTKAEDRAAVGDDDSNSRTQAAPIEEVGEMAALSKNDTTEQDNNNIAHVDKEESEPGPEQQQPAEVIETSKTDIDETQQQQRNDVEVSSADNAAETTTEQSDATSSTPQEPLAVAESADIRAPSPAAADANNAHAADVADASSHNGESMPLSANVNPSDVNGVDVTNTFEYPTDGIKPAHTAQPADQHSAQPTAAVTDEAAAEETEDALAPLPTRSRSPPLTVDPNAATSSAIAPPTPTVITPPANTHMHGYPVIPSSVASSPSSSVSSPTAPTATAKPERASISDPFADPFADDLVTASPARPPTVTAAKPSIPLKPNAALPSNPLFADEDDDDVLFASSAPKPKPAAATSKPASKRNSLFGDDDDDDDPLFK